MEVTDNKLKLVAGGSGSDVYTFNNIRFVVSASAVLRVDASVEFTGDDAQVDLQALLCAHEESDIPCAHMQDPSRTAVCTSTPNAIEELGHKHPRIISGKISFRPEKYELISSLPR